MTNFYAGLSRGPIDHDSSSVINSISSAPITMGSCLIVNNPGAEELLNRVTENPSLAIETQLYGVAIGGDTDGVYGDGNEAFTDANRATNEKGQGVVVCTQGRCLARVESTVAIAIGDPLGSSAAGVGNEGVLINSSSEPTSPILARALQPSPDPGFHMIAVDVQREGGSGEAEPDIQAFFIPQYTLNTDTTTTFDIPNAAFPLASVNSIPYAGTIKRILLGHNASIGDGFVNILRYPNGVGPPVSIGPEAFVGTPGIFTEKITYDKDFVKGDGLAVQMAASLGSGILTVTLEVEFDLT